MREVVLLPGTSRDIGNIPIELTHRLYPELGWLLTGVSEHYNGLKYADKIVYLGECSVNGSMFAVYNNGVIHFYRGKLNSGKY